MKLTRLNWLAAVCVLSSSQLAQAQYVFLPIITYRDPNAAREACLAGFWKDRRLDGDIRSASKLLIEYRRMTSTESRVTLPILFNRKAGALWIDGTDITLLSQAEPPVDRFVASGTTLDPKPIWFMKSGDRKELRGLWHVKDTHGLPTGAYLAIFRRARGWRFQSLELLDPAKAPAKPADYCEKPGDVPAIPEEERSRPSATPEQIHEMEAIKARKLKNKSSREIPPP